MYDFFYDFLRVNFGQRIVLLFFFFWFNKKVLVWLFKCKFWPKRTMQVSHICFMRLLPGECTILQVHNSLFFFLNVLGEKKKGPLHIYIYIYLSLSLSLSLSLKARMHHQQMHIANFIIYSGALKKDQLNDTPILSKAL